MFQIIVELAKVGVSLVLNLILWPVLIVITLGNEILRGLISLRLIHSGCGLLKHGADCIMWSSQLSSKTVVIGFFSWEDIQLEKEIGKWATALSRKYPDTGELVYSKLMKTLGVKFGYGCLLDDSHNSFNVRNHVKLFSTQEDQEVSQAQFTTFILPTLMETMDDRKPQWEWLIFPKIRRVNGQLNSLRVFRYDHGYMDGASAGLFLAENIFDQDPKPEFFINPRKSVGNCMQVFLVKFWGYFNLPLIAFVGVLSKPLTSLLATWARKQPFFMTEYKGKFTFAGPEKIDLKLVSAAAATGAAGNGKSGGGRIMSILTTSYATALYGCLAPSERERLGKSSIEIALPAALIPYRGNEPRNQYTATSVEVPFLPENSTLLVSNGMDGMFYFTKAILDWVGRFPIPVIQLFVSPKGAAVSFNSVPFLKNGATISGVRVEEVCGWAMLTLPLGVSVIASSYGDNIYLTACSVEDCMKSENLGIFLRDLSHQIMSLAHFHLNSSNGLTDI